MIINQTIFFFQFIKHMHFFNLRKTFEIFCLYTVNEYFLNLNQFDMKKKTFYLNYLIIREHFFHVNNDEITDVK